MKLISTLLSLLVAASVAPAAAQMPSSLSWEIGPFVRGRNYSEGMPLHPTPAPAGAVTFDFPVAGRGQIDAMTTAVRPLAGAREITMRYRIDAAPDVRFVPDEAPAEPATISVYFQQSGDDWSGVGRYETYRWYSPAETVTPLAPGEHTVTMLLSGPWIDVNGKTTAERPQGFAAALATTSRIGLAFGSPSLRSHGVYATAPARFTLLALAIE